MIEDQRMFLGDDIPITEKIFIRQPAIREIWSIGEQEYFNIASSLTSIPSDAKAPLDDIGINYMEISDFDFFILTARGLTTEAASPIIRGFDFDTMKPMQRKSTGEPVLVDAHGTIIDDRVHHQLSKVICDIHGFTKTPEIAGNEYTRLFLIDEDREKREFQSKKRPKSILLPLVSSLTCLFGSVKDVEVLTYYQARELMRRVQMRDRAMLLIQGIYSGNVDGKKVNKKDLDWTR